MTDEIEDFDDYDDCNNFDQSVGFKNLLVALSSLGQ